MVIYIVVSIDVEPDCTPSWHYSNPLTFFGVSVGIKERLHPLFFKHGIVPTYLINNVVLEDAKSIEIIKNLKGDFELGTHLHPEFIEPEKSVSDYAGSKGNANCCFYSPEVEYHKLKNITELFFKLFGYNPTSFRAGRFSVGIETIKSLAKLGYKVDTSVTPHLIWNDSTREKPIDFTSAPEQPYWIKSGSLLENGLKGEILEVPVTIIKKQRSLLLENLKSICGLRRPFCKYRNVWLRPHYSDLKDLYNVVEQSIRCNVDSPFLILNMMFHNVEVMPKLSPYSLSEKDCTNYLQTLDSFFEFCNQLSMKSISLSNVYELYKK